MMRFTGRLLGLLLIGTSALAQPGDTISNRALVTRFVDRFYARKDAAGAFTADVAPDYIQHNPGLTDGRDAAVTALVPMLSRAGARFDVKHVLVDGDLALVHLFGQGDPATPGAAVFDLYRMKNGKLVEHWDVIQPIAPDSDPLATAPGRGHEAGDSARNRRIITRFADLLFRQKRVAEAFTAFARPDMIQHNARLGTGRAGSIAAVTQLFAAPGSSFEVRHILVDGNLAAIHYRGKLSTENPGAAVIELFRLENGKIVEHWDAFQPMPASSPNPHPMF